MTVYYKWAPDWPHLDRDDLLHFFCLIQTRIKESDLDDIEFPPRLKRQFVKQRNGWYFDRRIDMLEYENIAYLSRFLDIRVPAAVIEASSFPARTRQHFAQEVIQDSETGAEHETGMWVWVPDVRMLDVDEVPRVLAHYDFKLSEARWDAGDCPACLRRYFVKHDDALEAA